MTKPYHRFVKLYCSLCVRFSKWDIRATITVETRPAHVNLLSVFSLLYDLNDGWIIIKVAPRLLSLCNDAHWVLTIDILIFALNYSEQSYQNSEADQSAF